MTLAPNWCGVPSPGECADGSGNWLPLYTDDGGFFPVCPSDELWPEAQRQHGLGQGPPTCIEDEQRELHMVSESVAVFAVAPFMFWLSAQKSLPEWARGVSFVIGAGTLAVDGWLLCKYAAGER